LIQEAQNLKTQIDEHAKKTSEIVINITSKQQELDNHYNGFIAKPNEQEPSKLEKITTTYQKLIENGENAEKINAKFKEYENIIFGNKETKTAGLKDIIEGYETDIKKKKSEWEESCNTLFKKIEGLLPGATSTGLASAYQEQGKKYKQPYWLWSIAFLLVTIGMIIFSICTLHDATTVQDALIKIISRTPFFVPAIWLAVFASKQQSQNRRLQEEYAHKETLSKSYESYKRELEKLPESPEKIKLLEKLLEAMVNMVNDNPSHTLQMRHHNDRPPVILDLFDKFKGKKEENPKG
jgi:hypothetical protein